MNQANKQSGFAVIIALSLMSFILLLLLSLTAFVRVETSVSVTQQAQLSAKQNALLGLQVALGELQSLAGSDQRATSRSQIVSSTATPVLPEAELWTGVWPSQSTVSLDGATPAGDPVWLVSGVNPDPFVGTGTPPAVGDVTLVPEIGTVGAVGYAAEVNAGKVAITQNGQGIGRYAWWVGDEGVKANITAITDDIAGLTVNERASLPWKTGTEALKQAGAGGISSSVFSGYSPDPSVLGRYIDFESLSFMAASPSALDTVYHDVTVYSKSLLTNPNAGGLKKDLTRILSDTTEFNNFIASEGSQMFEPQSGAAATAADPGGPLWSQLQNWANTGTGNLIVRPQTDTQAGYYPIITIAQSYMTVGKGTPTATGEQALLHLMPAVSLWNPYDRPLQSDSGYIIEIGASGYESGSFKLMDLPLILRQTPAEGNVARILIRNLPAGTAKDILDGSLYFRPLRLRIPGPITLAPGKNTVFSVPVGTSFHTQITDPTLPLTLEENWNAGASYYIDTGVSIEPGEIVDLNDLTRGEWMALSLKDGSGNELLTTFSMRNLQEETTPGSLLLGGSLPIESYVSSSLPINTDASLGYKAMLRMSDLELEPDTTSATYNQPRIGWLAHHNPRAHLHGPSRYDPVNVSNNNSDTRDEVFETVPTYYSFSDYREPTAQRYNDGFNFVVGTNNMVGLNLEASGIRDSPLFLVPTQAEDLLSIAELSHAYLFNDRSSQNTDYASLAKEMYDFGRYPNLLPAYPIGNSLADPRLPLDSSSTSWPGVSHRSWGGSFAPVSLSGNTHYDYSFLLNEALWDDFFFSGYTVGVASSTVGHPRLSLRSVTGSSPLDYSTAAAGYLLDGGFNINSTSVDAWKAVLSGLVGESIPDFSGGSYAIAATEVGFPRAIPASGNAVASGNVYNNAGNYNGFKKLTEAEIDALATALVDEIQARGPARTLAEFVNRDPNSSTVAHQKQGRLQAAIEAANLNAGMQVPELAIDDTNFPSGYTAAALTESGAFGVPGYLTQADILSRIGSILTSRSDTFVIRAYGEAIDPITNETQSEAWCEATVQRTQQPVVVAAGDPLNPAPTTGVDYGRRFEIINIRWLQDVQ